MELFHNNIIRPEFFSKGWVYLSYFCFLIGIVLILFKRFDVSMFRGDKSLSKKLIVSRFKRDKELARERQKKELMGIKKTGWKKQYNDLVQSMLISLKLESLSVENFTTFLIFFGILVMVIMSVVFKSVFLGLLVAIPSMSALFAIVLMFTKSSIRANDNKVMDSLDLICPTISHSVTAAIKLNMDAFDKDIRPHYQNFIYDIDYRGLLFREAIDELNRKLGPRFDDFADLAVMFYETGDEGMNAMFMDIVDINNSIRSINAKSDVIFKEANINLIGSSLVIIAFLIYAYVNPMTGDLMRNNTLGKFIGALVIALLIRTFAKTQIIQMTLKYDDVKHD